MIINQNNNVSSDNQSNNQPVDSVSAVVQNTEVTDNQSPVIRANPTLEMIRRATPIQLATISETNLSPEVRQELQIRKSSILGVYIDQNTNSQESFYSDEKPIEIQKDIPTGLIYKVQIAAFKKIVAPDNFKGINPISIEQRPNSTWYRYMAGNFTGYDGSLNGKKRNSKNRLP